MEENNTEEQASSPVPRKAPDTYQPQALNFVEALNEILIGKRVTKKDWNDEDTYGFMAPEKDELWIHIRGKDHQWVLSKGDIEGEDFFIVKV